jgi:RNA polymerase sigma-70 factor, ECF subfamily
MEQLLENIIGGCMKGSAESQKQLYKYCFVPMMRVCERYHSNDQDVSNAYNESMYTVLSKIKQYKGQGEFMGWVRRIFVNTSLNILKREKKYSFTEMGADKNESFSIVPEAYNKINENEVLEMVKQLPKQTAIVFNLYVVEGYTHEQIGDILNISINTSKWHLNNARTMLKDKIYKRTTNEACKNA